MNYRNISPALIAVLLTIVAIGSIATFDQKSRGTDALQAQSLGFDALAHQVFAAVPAAPALNTFSMDTAAK